MSRDSIIIFAVTLAVNYLYLNNIHAERGAIWSSARFWATKLYNPDAVSVAAFIANEYCEDVSQEDIRFLSSCRRV